MSTLKDTHVEGLVKRIYHLLMDNPEMGMGEMGDCHTAAQELVTKWIEDYQVEEVTTVDTIYENQWCEIIRTQGGAIILKSKAERYNDQFFTSLDECYSKTGLPPKKLKMTATGLREEWNY